MSANACDQALQVLSEPGGCRERRLGHPLGEPVLFGALKVRGQAAGRQLDAPDPVEQRPHLRAAGPSFLKQPCQHGNADLRIAELARVNLREHRGLAQATADQRLRLPARKAKPAHRMGRPDPGHEPGDHPYVTALPEPQPDRLGEQRSGEDRTAIPAAPQRVSDTVTAHKRQAQDSDGICRDLIRIQCLVYHFSKAHWTASQTVWPATVAANAALSDENPVPTGITDETSGPGGVGQSPE